MKTQIVMNHGDVNGEVSTTSGSIARDDVTGNVSTVSGMIKRT